MEESAILLTLSLSCTSSSKKSFTIPSTVDIERSNICATSLNDAVFAMYHIATSNCLSGGTSI